MTDFYCEKCQRSFHLCNSAILDICCCYQTKADPTLPHKECKECYEGEICECCGKITKRHYRRYIGMELSDCC